MKWYETIFSFKNIGKMNKENAISIKNFFTVERMRKS